MARTTDQQLSLLPPAPAPAQAVRRKVCKHQWVTLGVEVVYCWKCRKAFIDVDGYHWEDTWPLTKS